MVRGFCERLAAAGMPIARVHLSFSMLHPLYDALGFTWERGLGMRIEGFRQKPGGGSDRFLRSPYYHLLNNKLDHLRRRIDYSGPSEFPVFEDLKALGITDYMAFRHMFSAGKEQGMMGSWSTDSPSGFSESMIAALLRIQNHLAVAAKMAVLNRLADNMLTTYLGNDAGKRVLNGNIRRGQGDTIRAALVMADMRGSTMLAEQEGREAYIETLNQFFDALLPGLRDARIDAMVQDYLARPNVHREQTLILTGVNEDRREINERDEVFAQRAGLDLSRPTDDQRHVNAALICRRFGLVPFVFHTRNTTGYR
jgi:adenylate cyclase